MGSLQLSPIISVLCLGTVVESLGMVAGIGLNEISSPGGGIPTVLTKPSHEMAVVEAFGSDPRGPFPEHVLWEVAESLGGGNHPCSVHELLPSAKWDEYFPEDV